MSLDPEVQLGWVAPDLAEEFPELGIRYTTVEASPARSPEPVRERMSWLSNRYTGAKVIHMRQSAIPWAYRVFFRQVGLDPDTHRTPIERYALERLQKGAFRSSNTVDDALTIATVETSVPVVALDADRVGTALGLRLAGSGELLGGEGGRPLSVRQIVLADEDRSLAVLFGEVSEQRGVTPRTRRITLVAVAVKGVPEISLEEALWIASNVVLSVE